MPSVKFSGDSQDGQRASQELVNALEKLSRQAVQTAAVMKASLGSMADSVDDVGDSTRRSTRDNDRHATSVNRLKKDMGGLTFAMAKLNIAFTFLSRAMSIIKWPALITLLGYALQSVNALAAGVTALVSSLSQLAGIVAVIPTGIAMLVGSLVTAKLAFAGMGQAMGGNVEAWKKLTPEAQKFARELLGLKPVVQELREAAQKGLFPGLEEALKYLASPSTVGVAKDALFQFGQALGFTAARLAEFQNRKDVLADLRLFVTQTTGNMRTLAPAWVALADALRHVTMAAAPLVKWVTGLIVNFGTWAQTAAESGRQTGRLAAYFERTKQAMQAWGNILAGWGGTLLNVLKAARPLADSMTASIGGVGRNLQKLTGSLQGQNKLALWFEEMREPLQEIGKLFTAILGAVAGLGASPELTQLIRMLRIELLPVLTLIMTEAVGEFGTSMGNLVVQVARLISIMMGANGPLTIFINAIAGIAESVADLVENHPELRQFMFTLIGTVAVLKTIGAFSFVGALVKQFTLARVAAGAFQSQMVAGNAAVGASTVALGATIKAALITTGIGAVMVAAGFAVVYIITHWDKLKVYFQNWQQTLKGLWEVFSKVALAALKEIPRLGNAYFKLFAAAALGAFALILEGFYKLENWIVPGFGSLMKKIDNKLGMGTQDFKDWAADLGNQAKDDMGASARALGDEFTMVWDASMGQWVASTKTAADQVAAIINGVAVVPGSTGPGGKQSRGQGPGQQGGDSFQIPTSWSPAGHGTEHKTTGLEDSAGNARDYGAEVGVTLATRILAPEDGTVLYYHPNAARGGTGGTMQFEGASGTTYFLSHIVTHLKKGDFVKAGDLLCKLSAKGSPPHLHIDKVSDYTIPDTSTDPRGSLPQANPQFDSGASATPKWAETIKAQIEVVSGPNGSLTKALQRGAIPKSVWKKYTDQIAAFQAEYKKLAADGLDASDAKKLKKSWAVIQDNIKDAIAAGGQLQRNTAAKNLTARVKEMGAEVNKMFKDGLISPATFDSFKRAQAKFNATVKAAWKDGVISPKDIDRIEAQAKELNGALGGFRDGIAANADGIKRANAFLKVAMEDGFLTPAEIAKLNSLYSGLVGVHATAWEKTLANWQRQLDVFNTAWQSMVDSATQALSDVQDAARRTLQKQHDAAMKALRKVQEAAMDAFQDAADAQVEALRAAAEAQVEALQDLQKSARDALDAAFRAQMANLDAAHDARRKVLDDLAATQRAEFDAYAKKLRDALEIEVEFAGISFKVKRGTLTPAEALQAALGEYGTFASTRKQLQDATGDVSGGEAASLGRLRDARTGILEQLRAAMLAYQQAVVSGTGIESAQAAKDALFEQLFQFDENATRNMTDEQRAYWSALIQQQSYWLDVTAAGQRAAADKAFADAEEALEKRLLLELEALQERLRIEREALDASLLAEQEAAEASQEAQRKALEEQQEIEREALQKRLEAEQKALEEKLEAAREALAERQEMESEALAERLAEEQRAHDRSLQNSAQAFALQLELLKASLDMNLITYEQFYAEVRALAAANKITIPEVPTPPTLPSPPSPPSGGGDMHNGKTVVSTRDMPNGTYYYYSDGSSKYIPFGGYAAGGIVPSVAKTAFAMGGSMKAATGRVFAGSYMPSDSLVARVSPGEMVLTPWQQTRLFAIANGSNTAAGGGGDTVTVNVSGSVISERDLVDAVQRGLYRNKRQTKKLFLD